MIRVLLADDQELVRDGFAMILDAQDDIEVVGQAADGASSVELARALTPDVVLMDVRMPVMDGIEATRRIRAAGLHRLAVLMLTTFDLDEYVYQALRAGASGFLLKDVPRSTLIQAVRTVAAGEALLAPAITRRLIEQFVSQPPPTRALPSELAELTGREHDVLLRLARGRSNSEIGRELFLSEATVKPTSRTSCVNSPCATVSRPSSTPTRPASSIPGRPDRPLAATPRGSKHRRDTHHQSDRSASDHRPRYFFRPK